MFFKNAINFLEKKFFSDRLGNKKRVFKREKDFMQYYEYYFLEIS